MEVIVSSILDKIHDHRKDPSPLRKTKNYLFLLDKIMIPENIHDREEYSFSLIPRSPADLPIIILFLLRYYWYYYARAREERNPLKIGDFFGTPSRRCSNTFRKRSKHLHHGAVRVICGEM